MVIIVWPGDCVLPDFHSESGINLWIYGLKEYNLYPYFDFGFSKTKKRITREIQRN